jgi:hypothetical protein
VTGRCPLPFIFRPSRCCCTSSQIRPPSSTMIAARRSHPSRSRSPCVAACFIADLGRCRACSSWSSRHRVHSSTSRDTSSPIEAVTVPGRQRFIFRHLGSVRPPYLPSSRHISWRRQFHCSAPVCPVHGCWQRPLPTLSLSLWARHMGFNFEPARAGPWCLLVCYFQPVIASFYL